MPAKIDENIREEGRKRIKKIMDKYKLNPLRMGAKTLDIPISKIGNWRNGSTVFNKADELLFLHTIKAKKPEYRDVVQTDIDNFKL